jgi:hypothetical protein
MSFYWGDEDVDKIKEFYYCASAATSGTTRSLIFTELLPKFNYLINGLIHSTISDYSYIDKKDIKQELFIFIWELLNNYSNVDEIQGIQNYLWQSCRNKIYATYKLRTAKKVISITYYDNDEYIIENLNNDENSDNEEEYIEIQKIILNKIDELIVKFKKRNNNIIEYLNLMKSYLIENKFTELEKFKEYVLVKLNITEKEFSYINNQLKISTLVFKPQRTEYNYKDKVRHREYYLKEKEKMIENNLEV